MSLTISSKGWVVIPAELRKKYGLNPGDQVEIVDYGNLLSITPKLDNPIEEAAGWLSKGSSLTMALLVERQQDRQRERSK